MSGAIPEVIGKFLLLTGSAPKLISKFAQEERSEACGGSEPEASLHTRCAAGWSSGEADWNATIRAPLPCPDGRPKRDGQAGNHPCPICQFARA